MKKILYILFSICLFTACSSDDDNEVLYSIKIESPTEDYFVGYEYQLKAIVTPESTNEKVIWKSLNENVATISQTGLLKILSSGYITIRAKYGNATLDYIFFTQEQDYTSLLIASESMNPLTNCVIGYLQPDGTYKRISTIGNVTINNASSEVRIPSEFLNKDIYLFAKIMLFTYRINRKVQLIKNTQNVFTYTVEDDSNVTEVDTGNNAQYPVN